MKNNVKLVSIITCCVVPNMGPLRGPKHGTTAWPQTWDLTTPHPWDGVIACFPKSFVFRNELIWISLIDNVLAVQPRNLKRIP